MAEAPKRVHDPPTGQTPGKKPQKRRSATSGRFIKKSLFQSEDIELEDVEKDQKVFNVNSANYCILFGMRRYYVVLLRMCCKSASF